MLQLSVLRNDPAFVKERLAVKHCKQLDLVDSIIALDDQRKKLQLDFDTTQAKVNAASKEIPIWFARQIKIKSANPISYGRFFSKSYFLNDWYSWIFVDIDN